MLKLLGILVLGAIAAVLTVGVVLILRVRGWRKQLERDGVDGFAEVESYGFDANKFKSDGRIACVLHLKWKHPRTGQEFIFDSPWFWTEPNVEKNPKLQHLPVRVVLADPVRLHSVDLSGADVELWGAH